MENVINHFWKKKQNVEAIAHSTKSEIVKTAPSEINMEDLIKMKEATKLIKASPPTVRKYARMGFYKEYHFGEKLVFYNKVELLNYILSKGITQKP